MYSIKQNLYWWHSLVWKGPCFHALWFKLNSQKLHRAEGKNWLQLVILLSHMHPSINTYINVKKLRQNKSLYSFMASHFTCLELDIVIQVCMHAFRRLRQEYYEICLDDIVSSRSTWATEWDLVSSKKASKQTDRHLW